MHDVQVHEVSTGSSSPSTGSSPLRELSSTDLKFLEDGDCHLDGTGLESILDDFSADPHLLLTNPDQLLDSKGKNNNNNNTITSSSCPQNNNHGEYTAFFQSFYFYQCLSTDSVTVDKNCQTCCNARVKHMIYWGKFKNKVIWNHRIRSWFTPWFFVFCLRRQ